MASATILHVGEDFCQRIPVLESAGFTVLKSASSVGAIASVFSAGDIFSAVTFHSDLAALPTGIVETARELSVAPWVLFASPALHFEESEFDLVIPALTPPSLWLTRLREVIEACVLLREQSQQLRQDCVQVRAKSQNLRAQAARLRLTPIDADSLWRGKPGNLPPKA